MAMYAEEIPNHDRGSVSKFPSASVRFVRLFGWLEFIKATQLFKLLSKSQYGQVQ